MPNPTPEPSQTSQPSMPSPALHDVPPSALLLALELRALGEFGALLPAWPVLRRAPKGDGHAVLVFPGLSANDLTTIPLRRYIRSLGYRTSGWEQGMNRGPRAGVLEKAHAQLARMAAATGGKVSLVGWSLGGIFARELAKQAPGLVRCVVTLGTPFAGSHKSTNAWRLYELVSRSRIEDEIGDYDLPAPPPVPTTSIYSRSDGIVAWKGSVQRADPQQPLTENIEVPASHIGLGGNPATYWAVADRLAQPENGWRPFIESQAGAWPAGNNHGSAKAGAARRIHGFLYPDPSRP